MIFERPKGVRYVDMCIFIDNKVASGDVLPQDEATIYQYLYLIIHSQCVKNRYFRHTEDLDNFSLQFAADVYRRLLTNPKLKEFNEDGTPKMEKIKSVSNYINVTLYGRKVTYEQTNYSQQYVNLEQVADNPKEASVSSISSMRDSIQVNTTLNVGLYLESVSKTVKYYLYKNSPYSNNKIMMKNIYISCTLSLINALVFTEAERQDLQDKYTTPEAKYRYMCTMYEKNRNNCVILYHLSHKYYDYISLLVRQLFTLIGNDIQELVGEQYCVPEDLLVYTSMLEMLGTNEY